MKKILFLLICITLSVGLYSQNNILPLSKNVEVELDPFSDLSQGLRKYKKNTFSIYISTSRVNTLKKKTSIIFNVIRKQDNAIVYTFDERYDIDTTGQNGSILNPTEYYTYVDSLQVLNDSIKVLKDSIDITPTGDTVTLDALSNQLREVRQARRNLPVVIPVYEKINKFDDVIPSKIDNGLLTAEGLIWIGTLPFLGTTLDEYLE